MPRPTHRAFRYKFLQKNAIYVSAVSGVSTVFDAVATFCHFHLTRECESVVGDDQG
jgi:hypothetical protein